MKIIEVGNNKKLQREFLEFPVRLYKDNQYWIRPLDEDLNKIFDPSQNPLNKGDNCKRWLATNDSGEVIGRIAAFVNHNTAFKNEQPTGGVGFFESIDNQEVAFGLFDKAKEFLASQGMEAMDGPINLGERDRHWGLLVDPYDLEPTYGMDYHLPYYRTFFENYGFQNYFEQYTFWLPIPEEEARKVVNPALFERAFRIYENPDYQFIHIKKNQLDKFAEDFRIIYNKAWSSNLETGEMTFERASALLNRVKPILVEELMWFGYYKGEPMSFFIMLPELNQIFKHVNGKMNWIGKLKFLYHQLMKTNHKASGIIFGVIPEYQGRGIESAIAFSFSQACWKPNFQYRELELNWIADFNPRMLKVTRILGARKYKTYITYRYLFDRSKEFKRHPPIN
ncbi:MAG: hypothetical protein ACK4NY_19780 [Spirosomataceae bacterium]